MVGNRQRVWVRLCASKKKREMRHRMRKREAEGEMRAVEDVELKS